MGVARSQSPAALNHRSRRRARWCPRGRAAGIAARDDATREPDARRIAAEPDCSSTRSVKTSCGLAHTQFVGDHRHAADNRPFPGIGLIHAPGSKFVGVDRCRAKLVAADIRVFFTSAPSKTPRPKLSAGHHDHGASDDDPNSETLTLSVALVDRSRHSGLIAGQNVYCLGH
jgi:hypothetical protein